MADHVEEWFERHGPAGRQAFVLLNLPPPKARYLSRAVGRTVGGLRNLSGRSASFAATLRDILEPLESFERESAHPHFAESFRPVTPSGPRGSRSNKVQGSNPWWSALVEDCACPPTSNDALHLLFGIGSATFLLEPELSGITRRYAERLRWTLHDLDACTTLWTLTDRLLEDATERPLPIAMLLERSRRIPHNSKGKAGQFWTTLIQALGALTTLEERCGNPLLLRFGAWPTAPASNAPRIGLLAETEESPGAAFVELPTERSESTDAGDANAAISPESAAESGKSSHLGLSPDTPAGQTAEPNPQALHTAAESWARVIDERSLLPLAWSRLSNDEIDRIVARLRTPNPEWDSAAVSQVLGLIALGAHDEGNVRQRTLNLVQPPDAFVPKEAHTHLYRPRVDSVILTLDDIAHPPVEARSGPISKARDLLADLRRDRSLRALEGRIGRILPGRVLDATGELALVNDLFQNPDASSLGADYYAGYDLARLDATLMKVAGVRVTTSIPIPPDAVIGSAGVPRLSAFKKSVYKLRDQSAVALRNDRLPLHVRHNLYAAYTTLVLLSSTLHRFVVDPFHDPRQFLRQRNMALNSDKAVSRSHLTRLSPFGATPQKQEARYRVHLKGLAQKLLAHGHAIGHDILNLIGEQDGLPSPRKVLTLPFLFFLTPDLQLKHVSFNSFREVVLDWPWHQSAHRHLFSTLLREAGVPGEYVEHALGHWEASESPLGDWSVLSADDFLPPVTEAIEQILQDTGLTELRGLSPHRDFPVRRRLPSPPPEPAQPPAFGSVERRNRRDKATAQDAETVELIWNRAKAAAFISDEDRSIPAIVVHEARSEILRRFAHHPERVLHKLLHLRELTLDLRSKGIEVLVPGLAYGPTDDAPPVADLTGTSLQDAIRLRSRFTQWIEDHAADLANAPIEEVRVAALTSAILFGGLRRDLWAPFVNALGHTYARIGNVEWLMLATPRIEIRYLGDYITRMLFSLVTARYSNAPTGETSIQSATKPSSEPESASPSEDDNSTDDDFPDVAMDPAIGETSADHDAAPEPDNAQAHRTIKAMLALVQSLGGPTSAAALASCLSDDFATRVSGITNGWLAGRTPSVSLANTPFARLITGKRIHNPAPPAAAGDHVQRRVPHGKLGTTDLDVSRAFSARVFSALRDESVAASDPANPPARTKAAQSMRNAAIRTRMAAGLEKLASQIPPTIAPVLAHSLDFAITLTSKGGIRGRPLAPASIRKYVEPNLLSLLAAFTDTDPANLDDDERAEFYIRTLGPRGTLNRGRLERALALNFFDRFLATKFGIELAPWSEIEPGIFVMGNKVNANVITRADLMRLSRLEAGMLGLSGTAAAWLPALPRYLGAGLRTGEVWRVQPIDESSNEIWVRSNTAGSVKSTSGTRRAPDIGASLGVVVDDDSRRKSPRNTSNARDLAREDLADTASRACRMATGDQTVLPRHARHGFASNFAMLATQHSHPLLRKPLGFPDIGNHQDTSAVMCSRLTGRSHKSSLLLPALSLAIGHKLSAGYDSTTHASYTHVLELVAATELDRQCPELSQRAIAALRLMNHSTMRSILHRAPEERALPQMGESGIANEGQSSANATVELLELLERDDVGLDLTYLPEPGTSPTAGSHQRLEIEVMIAALSGLQQQQSIADVCSALGMTEEPLRDAIEYLARMPRGKGFNLFGLNEAGWADRNRQFLIWEPGNLDLSKAAIRRLAAELDSAPARTALAQLQEAYRLHPEVRGAVQSICSCFRIGAGGGHWTSFSPIQRDQVVRGLQLTGLHLVDSSGLPLRLDAASIPSSGFIGKFALAKGYSITATLVVTALATISALRPNR